MKTIYVILALLLVGSFAFGQTTVTYDFSAVGASTADNLDSNISFTTAQNFEATAPTIVGGQLVLDHDAVKGGSIIITPQNGVTITNVVIIASGRTNNAAYTVDGGIATELIDGSPYLINSITASTVVEFYQKQNGQNKEIDVDTFEVTYSLPTPITYTYTGTWSPSDPNGTSSTIDNIIVASNNATISANTAVSDVTVNPGASLTIDSGITLTTADPTKGLTLESSSMSYSSLLLNGTITGTVVYKRFVNKNDNGNDLISPPLAGETWLDFLSSGSNESDLLDDGLTSPKTYAFGPFDKATDWYVNYTDAELSTLILESGKGYRAATDIGTTGTTLTFTGTVPTTAITVNIEDTGAIYPDWNLIGNPYPSYLDMLLFLNGDVGGGETNMSILEDLSGIYGYDGSASNGWDIVTLSNASGRLMTPGQGFLVAANDAFVAAHDITFDPLMSVTGTSDDFIVGRNANVLTFLKLNASTSVKDYSTQFYFNDNASQGLDLGYDGKILGNAPNFAFYSHLVQDNTGLPIALQALNLNDLRDVTIPLGVNANQGEQLTFSIREMTLPSTVKVYLEDNVANTITLLNAGDYTLTPSANLDGVGRFYLRVTDSALSTPQNALDNLSIYSNQSDKTVVVAGQLLETTAAKIYDIQGRIVSVSKLESSTRLQTIDVSNLSTGVYVVQVINGIQNKTQKVIIR